jgi:hypothetical protein
LAGISGTSAGRHLKREGRHENFAATSRRRNRPILPSDGKQAAERTMRIIVIALTTAALPAAAVAEAG